MVRPRSLRTQIAQTQWVRPSGLPGPQASVGAVA